MDDSDIQVVNFFHPAYPDDNPPLLTLTANRTSTDGCQGIDWTIAIVACGIAAGNQWPIDDFVWFARKVRAEEVKEGVLEYSGDPFSWIRVLRPADDVLCIGIDYYFVIETPFNAYPVVLSFDHWRFPHGELPKPWCFLPTPVLSELERPSDARSFYTSDLSQVLPFSKHGWCQSNEMHIYYEAPMELNGLCLSEYRILRQSLALQNSVDLWFNQGLTQLTPYPINHDSQPELRRRLEIHPSFTFLALCEEVGFSPIYLHPDGPSLTPRLTGLCREYLFARFAFTILSAENYKFLDGSGTYAVRLFDTEIEEEITANLRADEIVQRRERGPFPDPAPIEYID